MQVLKFAGKFSKFCYAFKRKKIKSCFLPSIHFAFKRKKLTLANRYKIKTLANGYKSIEKNDSQYYYLHLPFATEKYRNDNYCVQQLF
jgi:hypothetical protein